MYVCSSFHWLAYIPCIRSILPTAEQICPSFHMSRIRAHAQANIQVHSFGGLYATDLKCHVLEC
jgi:hypothetical protein